MKDSKNISAVEKIDKRSNRARHVRRQSKASSESGFSTVSDEDASVKGGTNQQKGVLDESFKDLMNMSKKRPNLTPKLQTPSTNNDNSEDNDASMTDEDEPSNSDIVTSVDSSDEEASDDGDSYSDDDSRPASSPAEFEFDTKPLQNQKEKQNATLNDLNNRTVHNNNAQHSSMSQNDFATTGVHASQNMPSTPAIPQSSITNGVSDPGRPQYGSVEEEKVDLLFKLDRLKKKGYQVLRLDERNSIIDIRKEYNRLKNELELDHSIAFSRKILMAVISTIEFLNKRYDPFDIALDGWSESVMDNINGYDSILERLYYKYRNRVAMPPELELLVTLAGSAFMFHMTHSLFKAKLPSMAGNPDLMQSMMNAFTTIASQAGSTGPPPQMAPNMQQPQKAGYQPSNQGGPQNAPMQPQASQQPQQQSVFNTPRDQGDAGANGTVSEPRTYKMRGPDLDISNLTGGLNPVSFLPTLSSMLGGNMQNSMNNNMPATVIPHPIPSDIINLNNRPNADAMMRNEERAQNAQAQKMQNTAMLNVTQNLANVSTMDSTNGTSSQANLASMNSYDLRGPPQQVEIPVIPAPVSIPIPSAQPAVLSKGQILPDPPAFVSNQTKAAAPSTRTKKPLPSAAVDEDRLSDIISEDLDSIVTDALSTVISDADIMQGGTKTVSVTAERRRRSVKKAPKAVFHI